ncbi:uncharacterized protein PHALS_00125 [Plasmopara halstedii]|uniref:Uncharacterized protein n=1 Tax=Plasmopara halstedii TaxID=4781 RepID=A0A0P1A628_PLAHL|nr:uncharacterized protein PHALS_00125 [Plasmopara halstedii]CEG35794.1 hypothetical protein PHALS_00125 [Plasmopara halstedii]|eukprot:XP_024572163.1 hypothetical protein PHALS_00125 [Plasmopara halstedii]
MNKHEKTDIHTEIAVRHLVSSCPNDKVQDDQAKTKARQNDVRRRQGISENRELSNVATAYSKDTRVVAKIPRQVCNLGRQKDLLTVSDIFHKSFEHHTSIRKTLKLFQLCQEKRDYMREAATAKTSDGLIDGDCAANNGGSAFEKAGKDRCRPTPRCRQRSKGNLAKNRVSPLRLDYETDCRSLRLLGNNAQQWSISPKRKQFVYQKRERSAKAYAPNSRTSEADLKSDAAWLRAKSTQTNGCLETKMLVTCAESQIRDLVDKKEDTTDPEDDLRDGREAVRIDVPVNVKKTQKNVAVQCRVSKCEPSQSENISECPLPVSIAGRYPIWVDLNGAENESAMCNPKERKYILVAHYDNLDKATASTDHDAMNHAAALLKVSPSVSTVFESDREQANGGSNEHLRNNAIKTRHRTKYWEHFSIHEQKSSKMVDDQQASEMKVLTDLNEKMQRMSKRLQKLEKCANAIDKELTSPES